MTKENKPNRLHCVVVFVVKVFAAMMMLAKNGEEEEASNGYVPDKGNG